MKPNQLIALGAWLTLSHCLAVLVAFHLRPCEVQVVAPEPLKIGVFQGDELVYTKPLPDTRQAAASELNKVFRDLGSPLVAKPMAE